MTVPVVSVITAHGRKVLSGSASDRVLDILTRNGIPWSGVSVYADLTSGATVQRACLSDRLGDLDDVRQLNVYLNRNVNPLLFSLQQATTIKSPAVGSAVTEYAYQSLAGDEVEPSTAFRELTAEECRSVVSARVADCIRSVVPPGSTIVLGVSGGGDSNALLHALSQLHDLELRIEPLILQGIPDWDAGLPRARTLCAEYGLPLTEVDEVAVGRLLGMDTSHRSLVDRFESAFPGDDFEFLGTLLIRLALSSHARRLDTSFICTGLNFEDVLCEALYRCGAGLTPAAVPVRPIGELKLLMPLWRCPKKILDGCFPRYSLENYQARYPCFSLGRNLHYSVAYAIQSQFPGYAEQLVVGMASLGTDTPPVYRFDPDLGFEVERSPGLPLRRAFARMRENNNRE